jgi:hypothetical protein
MTSDTCEYCYCVTTGTATTRYCASAENSAVADYYRDYCDLTTCDFSSFSYDRETCGCPKCSTNAPDTTSSSCTDGYRYVEYDTDEGTRTYCELCLCEETNSGLTTSYCKPTASADSIGEYIRKYCNIDCTDAEFVYDDSTDTCKCPSCNTDDGGLKTTSEGGDDGGVRTTDKSDSIYEDDDTCEKDDEPTDKYSLLLYVRVKVEYIWDSRSELYSTLKRAWSLICDNSDFSRTNLAFYVETFDWEEDASDSNVRRLQDTDDAPATTEEIDDTTTYIYIQAKVALFDVDEDAISKWYEYFIALAEEFNVDYQVNCKSVSLDYDSYGLGTTAVETATLTKRNSDGETVSSVTIGETIPNHSEGYRMKCISSMAILVGIVVALF